MKRQLLESFQLCFHLIKRYKKRYASLHVQDRKAYIFPNTRCSSVQLPHGIKVCKTLKEFKIKNLRGGFQRRPELICQQSPSLEGCTQAAKSNVKLERIQYELATAALDLLHSVQFAKMNPSSGLSSAWPLAVDIGCGTGYSLTPLLSRGWACVGVDLDFSSLQRTRLNLLGPMCRVPSQLEWNETHRVPSQLEWNETHTVPSQREWNETHRPTEQTDKCECFKQDSIPSDSDQYLKARSPALDVLRWDLRHGLPFKQDSFDLALSISFLQWLFYGNPEQQLNCFFASLKSILSPSGRAIIQFYPQNGHQLETAVELASLYFHGVVIGDYPHLDRGRKLFILLVPLQE